MKIVFAVFASFFFFTSVTAQDTLITIQAIIPVDSTIKKEELYSKALQWVAQTYKSALSVIQMQDKDAGKMIINGSFKYQQQVPLAKFDAYMHYTGVFSFKDGKYRYQFSEFIPESAGVRYPAMTSGEQPNRQFSLAFGKKGWGKTQLTIKENMEKLVQSLVHHMENTGKDNW